MYTAIINDKTYKIEHQKNIYSVNEKKMQLDMQPLQGESWHMVLDHKSYTVELISFDNETKTCVVDVNGSRHSVVVKDHFDQLLSQLGLDMGNLSKVNDIKAPMPGMVLNIFVEPGQSIKKGDPLLVLEAMKMENVLKSPGEGTVGKLLVKAKDKVEKNQVLIQLS